MLAFAAIEMAGPWFLLTNAEKSLPSGLTGLIVACVPMVGAIAAYLLGDHHALAPLRLVGIAVGLGGVALLVAHDLGGSDGIPWWSIAQMLLVCVGYATAPFIVARRLHDVPALGVVAVLADGRRARLRAVGVGRAPRRQSAGEGVVGGGRALAVVCTAIAFIVFFKLISEVGPERATLITFVNPAVAIVLGAIVLDEKITAATVAGFFLVLGGCWLATRPDNDQREIVDMRTGCDERSREEPIKLRVALLTPDFHGLVVHALVVGDLDDVAVGIGHRADVADRVGHVGGLPHEATFGFAHRGDAFDLGARRHFDADVRERRHDRLRALVLISEEAHQHEDERVVGLVGVTEPRAVAVGIRATIEQFERACSACTSRSTCRCRGRGARCASTACRAARSVLDVALVAHDGCWAARQPLVNPSGIVGSSPALPHRMISVPHGSTNAPQKPLNSPQ